MLEAGRFCAPPQEKEERKLGSAPSIRGGGGWFHIHCAILGILGLLTCNAGARLTDSRGSHAFELGALCGSAESDLITPRVWWVFLPFLTVV